MQNSGKNINSRSSVKKCRHRALGMGKHKRIGAAFNQALQPMSHLDEGRIPGRVTSVFETLFCDTAVPRPIRVTMVLEMTKLWEQAFLVTFVEYRGAS